MIKQGYLEGAGRLSGGCGEAVCCKWGGCLEGVGGGCGEATQDMWECCLEGVGRLSEGCG